MHFDIGIALFPKRRQVRDWNDAVLQQLEEKYGDELDGVEINGSDPTGAAQQVREDKRVFAGIPTLELLKVRTCQHHRMRAMCTHNINTRDGWVNGTRVRLRTSRAWTGIAHKIKRSVGPEPRWCAQQVKLEDEKKFPEFNVYVVKDEECSLAKKVRYEDIDVQAIPFRNDASTVGGCFKMWKQVQIIPAYALTAHKGQGLTLSMTFLGLDDIFGFGLAYTMYTRS